jgi:hypothetical protein
MTVVDNYTREGKGRPPIEEAALPPDVKIALQARSQGLTWKDAAERGGMRYERLRNYVKRHPDAQCFLDNCMQDQLDQSHSILIEAAPDAAKRLVEIINDRRCKPYSVIDAIKTLFDIVEKGKTEREVAQSLNCLKEQLAALEGGPVYEIH